MFSKLEAVESRYEEVNMQLQRPDIASDQKRYRAFMKELADLEKIVVVYRDLKKKKADLNRLWMLRKVLAPVNVIDSMEFLLGKLEST